MRVLCVGRHAYLSDHLCRYFRELGVDCVPAVGMADAARLAASYEPHVLVCEAELASGATLDDVGTDTRLRDVPLLAVSLTRRPEEIPPSLLDQAAGFVYLPSLAREQARTLLEAARRRRGVTPPTPSFGAPVQPSFTA